MHVQIDNKEYSLDQEIVLDKNKFHNIEIIVTRLVLNDNSATKNRLQEAIDLALKHGKNKVIVKQQKQTFLYSKDHCCPICGFSLPEMEPRLFSFNAPIGACPKCKGLGFVYEPDVDKMIPNKDLSINQGAFLYFKNTIDTKSIE